VSLSGENPVSVHKYLHTLPNTDTTALTVLDKIRHRVA
jgi:hypothetical protein